jgi:cell division protein FtsB
LFRNQGAVNDSLIEAIHHLHAQNQELLEEVHDLRAVVHRLRGQLRRIPAADASEAPTDRAGSCE